MHAIAALLAGLAAMLLVLSPDFAGAHTMMPSMHGALRQTGMIHTDMSRARTGDTPATGHDHASPPPGACCAGTQASTGRGDATLHCLASCLLAMGATIPTMPMQRVRVRLPAMPMHQTHVAALETMAIAPGTPPPRLM